MINNDDKIIYVNKGDTLSGYEKLKPVPEKYIDELRLLFEKINLLQGSPILGMKQIYAFIARFNKKFVSTFTSCDKGCSACCNIDVHLTEFEAEYIVMACNIPHKITPLTTNHKSSCPFLSTKGNCSIYHYRPLFCRTYHVLSSPKLCEDKNSVVMQYGTASSNMVNFIYKKCAEWIYFQNQMIFGNTDVKDIRDFFPYHRDDVQFFLKANPAKSPC